MMDRVDTMKVLIKLGSNVNEPNNTGSTPLHAASLNGYGPSMELLVERGTWGCCHSVPSTHYLRGVIVLILRLYSACTACRSRH